MDSFAQSGTNAFADTYDCTENLDGTETCESQSLYVFEGTMKASGEPARKGEQVCYSEFGYTYDPTTGEFLDEQGVFGCTFDAGTMTIDKLTSITLAPTVIELMAWECDEFACTETPGRLDHGKRHVDRDGTRREPEGQIHVRRRQLRPGLRRPEPHASGILRGIPRRSVRADERRPLHLPHDLHTRGRDLSFACMAGPHRSPPCRTLRVPQCRIASASEPRRSTSRRLCR